MWNRELRLQLHREQRCGHGQHTDPYADSGLRGPGGNGGRCAPASHTGTAGTTSWRHGGMGSVVAEVARVNGVALNAPHELLDEEALRQRACTELLRQAAQQAGLLPASDVPGVEGAISVQASNAIEQLLERELDLLIPQKKPAAATTTPTLRHMPKGSVRNCVMCSLP